MSELLGELKLEVLASVGTEYLYCATGIIHIILRYPYQVIHSLP
jgi:hypothetical protein